MIRSIFFCIDWKRGIAKYIRTAKTATINGRITIRIADSVTSSRTARMMPPTSMMGAVTKMVSAIWTNNWTCWTSLVLRVISDGVPNRFISVAENCWTRSKTPRRTSRPNPIDALEANQTATIERMPTKTASTSMMTPIRQM